MTDTHDGPLPRLEEQLCFAVYSTAHAFNRAYRPVLTRLGLTYPQYLVMSSLWEQDGQTVKTLARRLFLDSGTMTPLLKRLELAGLINRARGAQDERQVIVSLTAAGQALEAKARDVPETITCAVGLTRADNEAFLKTMLQVRDALNAYGDGTANDAGSKGE
jgi:MarR family transcriptional regulator, organic hydroperoxide resistance regulator